MTTYELIYLVFFAVSILVSISLVHYANKQLSKAAESIEKLSKSNEISIINTILKIEENMYNARREVRIVAQELGANIDIEKVTALEIRLSEALESYLNIVDRLCSIILKNIVPDAKKDYRDLIRETIENYPHKMTAASRHRNIIKVHDTWSNS